MIVEKIGKGVAAKFSENAFISLQFSNTSHKAKHIISLKVKIFFIRLFQCSKVSPPLIAIDPLTFPFATHISKSATAAWITIDASSWPAIEVECLAHDRW
jgi:hypothetical protein